MTPIEETEHKAKINHFIEIINKIKCSDEQKKLWREIYENAINDRENARSLLTILTVIADTKSAEHAVHGKAIATYMERMSKSNDQLIRLSEMMAEYVSDDDKITPDDIYKQMAL